jgi:transcription elongation factor Elf1
MTTFEDLGKSKEAQWFNEHERELLKKARERKEGELRKKQEAEETAEREKLKAQHWLRCPKCGHEMEEKTLESIQVDECGFCGGVYFDAGELEQLFSKKIDESRGFFKRLLGA